MSSITPSPNHSPSGHRDEREAVRRPKYLIPRKTSPNTRHPEGSPESGAKPTCSSAARQGAEMTGSDGYELVREAPRSRGERQSSGVPTQFQVANPKTSKMSITAERAPTAPEKMPSSDRPKRTANQAVVSGSCSTSGRASARKRSTSSSLPNLASSANHEALRHGCSGRRCGSHDPPIPQSAKRNQEAETGNPGRIAMSANMEFELGLRHGRQARSKADTEGSLLRRAARCLDRKKIPRGCSGCVINTYWIDVPPHVSQPGAMGVAITWPNC
jgi:hypothetical protein